MTFSLPRVAVVILALSGASFCSAFAQTVQISPVSVEMLPDQMATTLMVANEGAMPTTMQVRPFRWYQSGGADQLAATGDLLVSPPIADIPPGATQIFRLVLRVPAQQAEATYRLLLDQLPPPSVAGMVRIALRFSIPVFAEPEALISSQVNWRIDIGPRGDVLCGINQGGAHVRVLNPVLTSAGGQRIKLNPGQTPYILPDATHDWTIDNKVILKPGATIRLAATSDAGPIDASVHVFGP